MTERIVRAAMTETRNAYQEMPSDPEQLRSLAGKLDDIRDANVEYNCSLIADAAQQGAQVIGLGELFTGPYFALTRDPMWRALAECPENGPTVQRLRAVAAEHSIVVIAPIYERTLDDRYFNTAVVIDADGSTCGKFRKVHIPQGSNEQGEFHEQFYYERSDGDLGNASGDRFFPVFTTRVAKVGVAICYDRHFPQSVATLAAGDAELIYSPAVTFGSKSERMWALEFPTDACRHRVFIGGSNRRGAEPPWDVSYFGGSYFVGPDGVATNVSEHEDLIIADLDLASLTGPDPSGWDLARDRR
ncbi:MAG: nitrilase-related carbon-nitrogen hydrolase [Planctomycetota bacterium]